MYKPNVPILGALADYDNFIMIDSMIKTVKDYFNEKGKEIAGNNVKALEEAFKEASK